MKKNIRVLKINGFRGLFLFIFVICCLVAGFIVFPAVLTMHVWNYLSFKTGSILVLNFVEGLLLWAIIAFSVFLFNKKKFIVSFNSQQELSEEEVNEVLSKVRSHALERNLLISKDMDAEKEKQEELQDNK